MIDGFRPVSADLDALMHLFVVQANHTLADGDAMRNPVIALQGGVNAPAETAFAVSRRPVNRGAPNARRTVRSFRVPSSSPAAATCCGADGTIRSPSRCNRGRCGSRVGASRAATLASIVWIPRLFGCCMAWHVPILQG